MGEFEKRMAESEIPGAASPQVDDMDIQEIPTSPDVLQKMANHLQSLTALSAEEREEKIFATTPEDIGLFLSEWSPPELCAMFAHRVRRAAGMETGTLEGLIQKLMRDEKYEEAKYPAKLLMEKGNHYGYTAYAKILNLQGKENEALGTLRKGIDDGVKYPARQYVSILITFGLYQEAIVECQDLVEKEPALWFSLFYCYDRIGNKEKAKEAFSDAIEQNHLKESMIAVRKLIRDHEYEKAKKLMVKVLLTYMSGYHMPEESIQKMGDRLLSAFTH